ncbi:Protein of unknown function DUF2143 [Solidesulfovibrio fructosivorans JJ]]|uniref:Yip1 domain-containing protein n=2 Tax=Solidesulfovibrio fructosivorans TaxID=878 RepID=E1JSF0_SOLFR|nr:Protein of unknown function DUF2143 [Solidesulfovibrio fructosivorans JJ]]
MRITCPQCGYFRELPDKKVPVTSTMATCPKCRHRFKFRADDDSDSRSDASDRASARPLGDTSSWRRPGPAAQAEPVSPPVTHWESPSGHDDTPEDFDPASPRSNPATSQAEAATPGEDHEEQASPHARGHQWSQAAQEIAAAKAREAADEDHARAEDEAFSSAPDHDRPEEPDAASAPRDASEIVPNDAEHDAPQATADAPEDREVGAKRRGKGDGQRTNDGVRDIWARLQAMDTGASRKRAAGSKLPPADEDPDDEAPEETKKPRETVTDPIPWERVDAYGIFPGLFLTLKKVLLSPVEFFSAMPEGRPKGKALVFNLLISEFLLVIDFLWSLMGLRARLGDPGQADALGAAAAAPGLGFLVALLLMPLAIACGIYLDAWITHLLLRLFRSANKSFNETFRVLCYSAAPTVLSAVPVAGQILSPVILVWYMVLQAIGLKKVHDGAYTQTLAVIFIKWSIYLFLLLAMLQNFTPGR